MNIGFALVTSAPFFDELVNIENEIHDSCGFHNRLETINNIPHTTLFQGSFKDDTDFVSILKSIRDYFLMHSSECKLHFQEAVYVPHGWYFYTCKITEELQDLHMHTLELCKNHIILSPDRMNRNLSGLTEDQIKGIDNYGYRYSEKAFFPHITIGRNDEEKNDEILELLNEKLSRLSKNIEIERMTVYRMGKDGMHTETLAEIML